MLYLFHIITDENPDFYRDLVIQDNDTFLDFHQTLQDNLGYDSSQLASFYITNERWEREYEITLIDMAGANPFPSATMEKAKIGDYIKGDNQRLLYVYDFFSERTFFIELIEVMDKQVRRDTPFLGNSAGDPPPQIALDQLMDDDMVEPENEEFSDQDDISWEDLDPDQPEPGDPDFPFDP